MKLVKFLNSSQLFKFCQKVLGDQKAKKIHDQEVGAILSFNPSDCSHWKKGEKNVKSVFALEKLAKALNVDIALIYDLASGAIGLDEAYYEYQESKMFESHFTKALLSGEDAVNQARKNINALVDELQAKADFQTPPLYLPEILRFFPFITLQQTDMMDRLSRVLRTKPQQYTIQFRKGELKPQTRMSIASDLARILLDGEREQYLAQLGPAQENMLALERTFFVAALLTPHKMFTQELAKIDPRRNVISELASVFWAPKSLVGFQLQDTIRHQYSDQRRSVTTTRPEPTLHL